MTSWAGLAVVSSRRGQNAHGQFGDGTTSASLTPKLEALTGADQISAAGSHLGIVDAMAIRDWGQNTYGELGDGTTTDAHSPEAPGGNFTRGAGSRASYSYDGDGLRAARTLDGTAGNFSWDESGGLPALLSDPIASYIYGPDGLVVEQINNTNGVALFYHHDQLGSTRMLTEVSGNTASTFSYSPYGTLTGSTGTKTTPFGFAGAYTDSETGFQYLRARYYDPQSAQFISRDPLGLESGETNLYGYAGRDPEDLVDPSGLCDWRPWKADACSAEAAAGLLDGLTGGYSTQIAGSIIGFNPDCAGFGSGVAHGVGFAGSFFLGGLGEENVAAEGVSAAEQEAYAYATEQNKLGHIFDPEHDFQSLVQHFGSPEAVVQQMLNELKGLTPAAGTFEETITVGGQPVVVRGAVVNGVVKIGTAFPQP